MPEYTPLRPECACGEPNVPAVGRMPYAMAFVQPQRWETPFCAEDALEHGCAFPSLVLPFLGKEVFR